MSAPARSRGLLAGALLLGLLAVAAALRARAPGLAAPVGPGAFGPASARQARALIATLARGLLAHQRADGAVEAGPDWAVQFEVERVVHTALAAAALAEAEALGLGPTVPGLGAGLDRALAFLTARQASTGPIGERHPKDAWSQVEATAAAIHAAATRGDAVSEALLARAGPALARMAQGGIRSGWTRAVALLAVDRVLDRRKEAAFGRPFRQLVDRRQANEALTFDGRLRTSDWNLAEAIARTLLQVRVGLDDFPARLADALLAQPPTWTGQGSDAKSWWMAAWIVGRTGRGGPWFEALLRTSVEDLRLVEGLVPASFYASGAAQTAALLLALSEGLRARPGAG